MPIRLGVNAKSSNDMVCLYGIKTASMALPIDIKKTKSMLKRLCHLSNRCREAVVMRVTIAA